MDRTNRSNSIWEVLRTSVWSRENIGREGRPLLMLHYHSLTLIFVVSLVPVVSEPEWEMKLPQSLISALSTRRQLGTFGQCGLTDVNTLTAVETLCFHALVFKRLQRNDGPILQLAADFSNSPLTTWSTCSPERG